MQLGLHSIYSIYEWGLGIRTKLQHPDSGIIDISLISVGVKRLVAAILQQWRKIQLINPLASTQLLCKGFTLANKINAKDKWSVSNF